MYDEDDFVPISALQHLAFCPRQCALIHIEGLWEENQLTAEGRVLHDRTLALSRELRGEVLTVRSLRLCSRRLGLSGQADVVEFHRLQSANGRDEARGKGGSGVALEGVPGVWRPFPVEYKRGRPKPDHCDEVQLCAQALCLEEMLRVPVPAGAIFYGQPRRRLDVAFGQELRSETESLALQAHAMFESRTTPPAQYRKACRNCSLLSLCLPRATSRRRRVEQYLAEAIAAATAEGEVA